MDITLKFMYDGFHIRCQQALSAIAECQLSWYACPSDGHCLAPADSCGARHLEIAFGRETVLATRRRSHEPAVWQLRHPCGRELPGERPDRLTLNRAAIF